MISVRILVIFFEKICEKLPRERIIGLTRFCTVYKNPLLKSSEKKFKKFAMLVIKLIKIVSNLSPIERIERIQKIRKNPRDSSQICFLA